MSNMTYCMFHNTLNDLRDCVRVLTVGESLSREERISASKLIELCRDIANEYGDDTVEEILEYLPKEEDEENN